MESVLSVVIPIYNLERCVLSVINQDLKDLEVILVDDGSPDKCPQICEELAKSDERIKNQCSMYEMLDMYQSSFEYNLLIYDTI